MTTVSQLPITVDLKAYAGDTWRQSFRLLLDDGTPIEWDDVTAIAAARRIMGDDLHELTVETGDDGLITIGFPEAGPLEDGTYSYDVELTTVDVVRTWVRGKLSVIRDVAEAGS